MYDSLAEFFRHVQRVSAALQKLKSENIAEPPSDYQDSVDVMMLAIESLHTAEIELSQQYAELLQSQHQAMLERERYYHLFYGAPDAYVVTDIYGAIREANLIAEHLFNIAARYLLHKPLVLYIVPHQRRDFRTFLSHLLLGQERLPGQEKIFAVQSRNQSVLTPVAIRAVPMRNEKEIITGVRWLLRALSLQTRIEEQLQQTNETLRSLLDAFPLAMIALDRQGLVQLWNKAAETLFGWTQTEVLGQVPPHVPEQEMTQFWEHFNTLKAVPLLEVETVRMNRAGEPFPVRLTAAPMCNSEGTVVGTIAILVDLHDEYQDRNALRTIRAKLTNIQDEERRHLARELHDNVIQKLIGLQFYLSHLRRSQDPPKTATAEGHQNGLVEIGDEIATVVRLLRAILNDLRPPGLETFGLRQALESYIGQCRQTWIPPAPLLTLVVSAELPFIPMSVAQVAMRVVQEALTNVRRHAGASTVEVRLSGTRTHVSVAIQDNGKGFQTPRHVTTFAQSGHFGLLGIMQQVEGIGGFLEIRSQTGGGTQIRAVMTLPPDDEGIPPMDASLA